MSNNNIEQIRQWANGTWVSQNDENNIIEELATDSRNIEQPETALFIAIKTQLRNGHTYIATAWRKGVRNFLVSDDAAIEELPGSNIIKVTDTLEALQNISAAHREQFDIPVIGITGSNGKTIVKEWLYQLLSGSYNIVRSPKSYNSQIGVPLSVWQLNADNDLAIFEAGISQPGEMEKLERILQPTIGIFTNIGQAHSEGFTDLKQKVNEKLLLFKNAQQLVYCLDHTLVREGIVQYTKESGPKLFTWSQNQPADLRIVNIDTSNGKSHIMATYRDKPIGIVIPFTDDASIENAIHCWCVLLLLGENERAAQERMTMLQPVSMRLELMAGINNCTIINDTYNSDLTSLHLALNYLDQQKQHPQHTLILSDMLQAGKRDADIYEEVVEQVARHGIKRFIGVGPALFKHKKAFRQYKKLRSIFFKSTAELLKNFHLLTFDKEAILIKGARVFAFEKISLLLEQKIHQTVMSIDLYALTNNLNAYRGTLSPGVKTMAMVKAFAYGSGSYEIASLLQYAGVDYLAVAYTDEGIALRKAGIKMPIMVMSPDATTFDRMIAWKLEPEIFNFRSLEAFTGIARTLQVAHYPVHIKLDTGMHRLGFNPGDMKELAHRISQSAEIKIASIFSHLAASDDPQQDDFTTQQARQFGLMSDALLKSAGGKTLRHICNSAAIVRRPELQFDMVRLGLGLYGVDGTGLLQNKLNCVSTLKTMVAQVHDVPAGDSVGYGHHAIVQRNSRIATVCIGYADGYPRSLGNGKAYMLIHGKPAYTVGSICMDMCMLDVTDNPWVKEGDEVLVFCRELPVTQLAKWAGTIPYEIMTSISQRVKRVYVNGE